MKTSSVLTGGLVAALGLTLTAGAAGATTPPGDEPGLCEPWQTATAQFSSDAPDPAVAEQAVADVTAAAPDEIAESVATVVAAATQALAGDFSGFESPDFQTSVSEVDNWVFDNCAFDNRIEVQAVDWAFGDIPLELPAGRTAFRLTNLGDEQHEIAIVRKAEGTTESFHELAPLLAAEDPAAMEKIEFIGGGFSPGPDMPGVAIVDLVPGEYAALCFIPVGSLQGMEEPAPEGTAPAGTAPMDTTGGTGAEGEAAYDPHFNHGMLQEFTVVDG